MWSFNSTYPVYLLFIYSTNFGNWRIADNYIEYESVVYILEYTFTNCLRIKLRF